ncbi:alpha/beta hydrolase [Streptomyces sp. NPDC014894]|uniref:alpha/beta hydrolase n=1 Tax=Streptomyces sp. NPDC014894 TaxID=3364931 RepID=UPI0036F9970E
MASRTRPRLARSRRALIAALLAASVAVPVSGAARPGAVPAPVPPVLAPLTAATPEALRERYAVNRAAVRAAERTAAGHGDHRRAAALRALAAPERRLLSFDGRDGGRSAEVFGEPAAADRIAVLVPGADTSLDDYWRLRADALALSRELGDRAAVVAWLGYRTPATVGPEALTTGRADAAAPELRRFVRELVTALPAARTALLCHSYGSVVCARAAPGLPVDDIVLYGSPGTGGDGDRAARLGGGAAVWAGRSTGDWVAEVPDLRLRLPFVTVGFGTDPVSEEFGARIFDAGSGGHGDYLRPGSVPLRSIARIVARPLPSGRAGHV